VVDAGGAATIEGSFHLLPSVRVVLLILASLVLLAGIATSMEQRIVTPGLVTVLVVLGGALVIGRQINRSASGEEAVLKLLIDVAKGI
jgi:hypothetical protein